MIRSAGALLLLCGLLAGMTAAGEIRQPDPHRAPLFSAAQMGFLGIACVALGAASLGRPARFEHRKPELALLVVAILIVFLVLEDREVTLFVLAIGIPACLWLVYKREALRARRAELLLLAFVSLACFLTLEVVVRLVFFGPRALQPRYGNSITPLGTAGLVRASDLPGIPYELKPDLDTYHGLARITTNSDGLHDREYTRVKPEGTYRVAVLGDSLSQPMGVAIEDAYHSLLEDRCNAAMQAGRCEFINFAVGGYSLADYLAVLRQRALAYDPDHVLVGIYLGNDLLIADRGTFQPKRTHFNSYVRLWAFRALTIPLQERRIANHQNRQYDLGRIEAIFAEFASIGEQRQLPFTLAVLRRIAGRHAAEFDIVVRAAERHGFHLIDTAPAFEGVDFEDTLVHRFNPHPNAAAHARFAAAIAEAWEFHPNEIQRKDGRDR